MDTRTRRYALMKAKAITAHIAYSNEFLNDKKLEDLYEKLEVNPDDYLQSYLNVTIHDTEYLLDQFRKPVNKSDWVYRGSPAILSAGSFVRKENILEFPASILQGFFFDNEQPQYMNYGGIGFHIAHEITHGFDDYGRLYDIEGNYVNWWTQKTEDNFQGPGTDCIILQYENYYVEELGRSVDGIATQDENIADNGGIKMAYRAYKQWLKRNGSEPRLPGLDYTPSQLFWINASQTWCTKYTLKTLFNIIMLADKSPAEFRINGAFSNQQEFVEDFKCPKYSMMNRNEKCHVW